MQSSDATEHSGLPLDTQARNFIASLPEDEQDRLNTLITTAADNQRAALRAAMDDAVRMVPAPLRGRLRKFLLE